ncbi:helix-turn-helix domain-containing protein [Paenibacillus donghaensis]|uniref:helix-turn-helix domain-containing protein n=1 Tax=Paenibacillus donghaensis TaxID=414771 RepID=UPI001883EE21|nr:helix-turn-helix domain-containing protein [Paenibacillus donghaensis]MBE9917398.1 helix-turn-helix domain-containing protein [Paenibacillus donghaensis]
MISTARSSAAATKFAENSGTEAEGAGQTEWVKLKVELTHQELASMTGNIRETVTETLNQLMAEGILKRNGSRKTLWIHTEHLKKALVE